MFGGTPGIEGVKIVPLPVVCERYYYRESIYRNERERLGYKNNLIFVHTGRFWKQKNHEFLIDIFAEICKKRSDAILFLLGDGELKDQIKNKVKELNLDEKVIFWGNVSDVGNKLIMSDAFLFPSLYEGFPTVVLEAQAAGLPCYISDTITSKIAETELVKQIALNQTAAEWSDFILSDMEINTSDRRTGNSIIAEKYDIKITKEIFVQLYT